MENIFSNVSINSIIQIILAILGVGGIAFLISVKVSKSKDNNKIKDIDQKIENGNNNNQAGRDINVKK
jgi:hypothetical protein